MSMDFKDISAFKHILQTLVRSENVKEIKIPKLVDERTVSTLRNLLEHEPGFASFRVHVGNNDENVHLIRIDDAGRFTCSTVTENTLSRTRQVTEQIEAEKFTRSKRQHKNETKGDMDIFPRHPEWDDHRSYIPPAVAQGSSGNKSHVLPIAFRRIDIEKWLRDDSPVGIVYGAPGCGKSAQIVQYILQECIIRSQSCRAICVFQEDVEVYATARQICDVRQEMVGNTIGYKIADSCLVNESTNVAMCTDEVMILSFMSDASMQSFAELTHVIVNNVGKRTVRTDFLLSLLKEKLQFHPTLKLLLLTDSLEVGDLMKFFNKPAILELDILSNSQLPFGVKCCYLDYILKYISTRREILEIRNHRSMKNPLKVMAELQRGSVIKNCNWYEAQHLDSLLEHCWFAENSNEFNVLLMTMELNRHLVDYQHTETRMTLLMIAAAKGFVGIVQILLRFGSNPYVTGKQGLRALDWCTGGDKNPCWQLINNFCQKYLHPRVRTCNQNLLICQLYHQLHNPYVVDHSLVLDIVLHINMTQKPANILVTLPDYTDVLECFELLRKNAVVKVRSIDFMIYHRFITKEEVECMNGRTSSTFLIILVAELLTGLLPSLDCIDYVIDTGLTVRKVYTPNNEVYCNKYCYTPKRMERFLTMLAKRGCFFLYTVTQHESMPWNDQPDRNSSALPGQILQTFLCRNTTSSSIEKFLDSALTSPPSSNVNRSIELLMQIGAIERPFRQPTKLGHLLVNLCNEVHLAKTILYSILFKCLDPVLTIVASLRVGNLFKDPLNKQDGLRIVSAKKTFSQRSYSDCLFLLRIYQEWTECKLKHRDDELTSRYGLKVGAINATANVRSELMTRLRSLGIVSCGLTTNIATLNTYSDRWVRVKACLAAGFYPNLAKVNYRKKAFTDNCGATPLALHPLSVVSLEESPTKWVIYDHKEDFVLRWQNCDTTKSTVYIVENTVISDAMVLLMCHLDEYEAGIAEKNNSHVGNGMRELIIDKKYTFQLTSDCFQAVLGLRRHLGFVFHEFTCSPLETLKRHDVELLISHICSILEEEERNVGGLRKFVGIGTRPKIKSKCSMGVHWN